MPSEKRSRQRAAREARLAAEAKHHKRRQQFRNVGILAVVAGVVVGVLVLTSGTTPKKPTQAPNTTAGETTTDIAAQKAADALAVKAGCPVSVKTTVNKQHYAAAPPLTIDPNKLYSATIVTTDGTFDMSLFAKAAPKTVNSFVFLADKGYFKCNSFFRVEQNFVDQVGDPTQTGRGGPGYTIDDENLPKSYAVGDVAMANSGPNTNGSQFFVVATGGRAGLGPSYSLFGHVNTGQNVVDAINEQGNSAAKNGVPPLVTQRILSVIIHESSGA